MRETCTNTRQKKEAQKEKQEGKFLFMLDKGKKSTHKCLSLCYTTVIHRIFKSQFIEHTRSHNFLSLLLFLSSSVPIQHNRNV